MIENSWCNNIDYGKLKVFYIILNEFYDKKIKGV